MLFYYTLKLEYINKSDYPNNSHILRQLAAFWCFCRDDAFSKWIETTNFGYNINVTSTTRTSVRSIVISKAAPLKYFTPKVYSSKVLDKNLPGSKLQKHICSIQHKLGILNTSKIQLFDQMMLLPFNND